MGWIKFAGKTLEYAGKLAQAEGFEEWAGAQGRSLVEKLALQQGFHLLGKKRAAKNRLWEELQLAAGSDATSAAIQAEAEEYPKLLGRLAGEVSDWPSSNGYHGVIAVPRAILNEVAFQEIRQRLGKADELTRLSGGEILLQYFFGRLVRELDSALAKQNFSPRNPLAIYRDWLIIGIDRDCTWPQVDFTGHYYLCDPRNGKIERAERDKFEKTLVQLTVKLGRLSAAEKTDVIGRLRKNPKLNLQME